MGWPVAGAVVISGVVAASVASGVPVAGAVLVVGPVAGALVAGGMVYRWRRDLQDAV